MTKNPFINAGLAAVYIVAVASIMFYGPKIHKPTDTVFVPIAVLSLFSLSAAVMGYLFLWQPFQLYFDGRKKAAFELFMQTLAVFAVITAVVVIGLFSGLFR